MFYSTQLLLQKSFRAVFVVLALFVLSGCLRANPELFPPEEERQVTAYVTGHGWHTGIVIDRDTWFTYADSTGGYPSGNYYEFGWGDRDFFMDPDAGFWPGLKAALWPTSTVIHISGFTSSPEDRFPNSDVVKITLSDEGVKGLIEFIDERMRRKPDNSDLNVVGSGLYGDAVFIEARGRYILPYTCNVWTGRALRNAGFPITPIYAVGRRNTIWQVTRHGEVLRER